MNGVLDFLKMCKRDKPIGFTDYESDLCYGCQVKRDTVPERRYLYNVKEGDFFLDSHGEEFERGKATWSRVHQCVCIEGKNCGVVVKVFTVSTLVIVVQEQRELEL